MLPRFKCPYCGSTIDNIKFKGRLHHQRPKRGKIIDRGVSTDGVDEKPEYTKMAFCDGDNK